MRTARPASLWGPAGALALLLALALASSARADMSKSPDPKALDAGTAPQIEAAPAGQRWWDKILRDLPNCAIHTDGCRLCNMKATGISCSNSPIACQPGQWRCGQTPPEPKTAPDKPASDPSSPEKPAVKP